MFGWVTDRCEKQHQRVCPVVKYAQSKSHNPAHSLCHWVIMRIHAYPEITFSDNKNHPSLKHSIIFQNTSPNVSPHLWNKSSNKILWENRRAIHCAPPLTIPRSWEPCLPITLDCPPVQSFHNGATKFRVHASVTFLINDDEKPLLMVGFLKRLETSPFHWRRHAFPPTWNNFANGALIPKIYSACNFTDALYSLGNFGETFFLLHVLRAGAEHFQEQISIFLSFAHAQRFQKWLR